MSEIIPAIDDVDTTVYPNYKEDPTVVDLLEKVEAIKNSDMGGSHHTFDDIRKMGQDLIDAQYASFFEKYPEKSVAYAEQNLAIKARYTAYLANKKA